MDRMGQRKERLDLCFKHPSCKTCPRNEQCEKENGGDNNAKTKKVQQRRRYAK